MCFFRVCFVLMLILSFVINGVFGGEPNYMLAENDGFSEEKQGAPYKFGYRVNEEWGETHRQEESDGNGQVVGSYGFTDPYGMYRQVNYIADALGFRAQIQTNEPGTANQQPADVRMMSRAPTPTNNGNSIGGGSELGGGELGGETGGESGGETIMFQRSSAKSRA